ncbi:MAG: chromate transporter [Candidatus Gastranaerophilales bacterium]|nr:chromate transporter [Candidatus Gastranaerophilales bacterium]
MKISIKDIYIQFFLLGLQLLGGGYVIIPLMKKYIIDEKKWITEEDLTEFYALSQSIPGIIAANISTFTGYKLRGKIGAAAALLGIISTPVISIILIATILDKLLKISFIQSIFWGVGIAVIILVYLSVKEMWTTSMTDKMSWVIFAGTIFLSLFLKISPATVIVIAVIFGLVWQIAAEKRKKE